MERITHWSTVHTVSFRHNLKMIYRHTYLLTKSEGIGFFMQRCLSQLSRLCLLRQVPPPEHAPQRCICDVWPGIILYVHVIFIISGVTSQGNFPRANFYDWTRQASHLAQVCVGCFFVLSCSERSKRWMLRFLFSWRYYWHLSTVKWEVCTRSCLSCVRALN